MDGEFRSALLLVTEPLYHVGGEVGRQRRGGRCGVESGGVDDIGDDDANGGFATHVSKRGDRRQGGYSWCMSR